jgi:hypothetical protein
MVWTMIAWLYVGIAAIFMHKTLREHRANRSGDVVGLGLGGLACLVWPVAAVLLLIMVNMQAKPTQSVN